MARAYHGHDAIPAPRPAYYKVGQRVIVQGGNNDARGMTPQPDAPWPEGTLIENRGRGWWQVQTDDGRIHLSHGQHLFPLSARPLVQRWQDVLNAKEAASTAWVEAKAAAALQWELDNPYPYPADELRATADPVFASTPYGRR